MILLDPHAIYIPPEDWMTDTHRGARIARRQERFCLSGRYVDGTLLVAYFRARRWQHSSITEPLMEVLLYYWNWRGVQSREGTNVHYDNKHIEDFETFEVF